MVGKFLLNTNEAYRVPSLNDVETLHEIFNEDNRYELNSFSYTAKFDKKTDTEYYVVKCKKTFNAEKEPMNKIDVDYIENPTEGGF